MKSSKTFYNRISNIVIALAIIIVVLVGIDILLPPFVKSTNLTENIPPSALNHIEITFNRAMDRRSVEQAFKVDPPLEGVFLWHGNTVSYELENLPHYDQSITLTINASARDTNGKTLTKPFVTSIQTAPVQILYLGSSQEELDRLILYNPETKHKQILTQPDFAIEQFAEIPQSKDILLLGAYGGNQPELYRLTPQTGTMTQLTNDPTQLNNKFTISPTGDNVALSRIQLSETGTYLSNIELWLASTNDYKFHQYQPGNAQGSDVYFSFDGSHLLYFNQNYAFELAPITA
ncbi:MAG TPA: Ig-like domain-containing protein, partial [Candidatus Gracilibacteria bacterium]|nr:Ig-like domain-containing protein [Candidatus Gracilibacteria bacterium]